MQNNKVFRLLVGKDVAVNATTTTTANATDGAIVPFTDGWAELLTSDTIATSPSVYLMQKVTNASNAKIGSIMSLPIYGSNLRGFNGESFRPGQEQISYLGLAPSATTIAAGTGDVVATVGEYYELSILNAAEKEKYQVPERYDYVLPTGGTKLSLCTEFARVINNNTNSIVTARVIGNGTGTDGLTSATAYGLQLKGKSSDSYFSVGKTDSWGADVTDDTKQFRGEGTVEILEEVQKYAQGYLGYLNRFTLPKEITNYVASQPASAMANSGGTLGVVQNSKVITFSAAITTVAPVAGDKLVIDGVTYGIASVTSGTVYVLTEPYKGATASVTVSSGVTKLEGYDVITLLHDIPVDSATNINIKPNPCATIIAIPSLLANATAKTTFLAAINAWALTTPGRFANVTV